MKIKTIPDEEILDLINCGRIVIKYLNRKNPVIFKDGKKLSPYIVWGSRCSDCDRWAIKIGLPKKPRQKRPRRRSIVRSRLVWMYVHRRIISLGEEIHHDDEDRLNDQAKNLINWAEDRHRSYHNGEVPF